MRISIFGLGYVGAVSAGCLASRGHEVVGVDPNKTKVDLLNEGCSPIIEPKLPQLLSDARKSGRLSAVTEGRQAVLDTDISMVCVGTPSQSNGSLDLSYVRRVSEEIGAALKEKDAFHTVVIRSTMLPGGMRDVVIPALEQMSGKTAGEGFGVCNNPEFLREGTAVDDFCSPPKTVIGELNEGNGDPVAELYADMDAPMVRVDIETAEMVKYSDNSWHALKVCFANEIGNICKSLGVDSHKVMNIFCQDTKLNLSPYYMKPGFAFGGSCLPKDVRALTYKARSMDVSVPVLEAILPSNRYQIEIGIERVVGHGHRNVGILGFSFKAGTDDLRESPVVELIECLIGKGYDLRIYDKNVNLSKLVGANRDYILNHIPHISKLMVDDIGEVLHHAQTLVIGNSDPAFGELGSRLKPDQVVVDLVRITDSWKGEGKYDGLCW